MIIPRWKKGLSVLIVLLAGASGLFLCHRYWKGGDGGAVPTCSAASLAEARIYPEKKDLALTQRMLAAQVLVFPSSTYEDVEESMRKLKGAGVNTIIVRAFQNPGDGLHRFVRPQSRVGAYFETAYAPVVAPVLSELVSIGHRNGLKVFAWMETRKMPLLISESDAAKAWSYDYETGRLKAMALWSIFDETFQSAIEGLYRDAVLSGVDGILIQDDLISYQHEDFNPKGVALFEKETGHKLIPETLYPEVFQEENGRWVVTRYSDTFWVWVSWKNRKLLELAGRLIETAKAVNPEIEVAMNFMYEAVTDPRNALAWLAQSLAEAKKLPLDYYVIMAYHRQIKDELGLSEEGAFDEMSKMTASLLRVVEDPYKIVMKVQMTDWKTRKQISSYEANQVFERISDEGKVSLAFVPYSHRVPLQIIGNHFQ
jgi:hypothetical protein